MRGFNRIPEFIRRFNQKKYRAAIEVGEFCVRKMQYYVPVDTGYLSSRCAYEIKGTINIRTRLKNDAYYSGFVEFGTSRQTAQPFMRPAQERHRSEISSIIARNMRGL